MGFLSMPGGWEWIVILVALLLLFGHRLPSVMRSLGRSVAEFKKGVREAEGEIRADAGHAEGEDVPSGGQSQDSGQSKT